VPELRAAEAGRGQAEPQYGGPEAIALYLRLGIDERGGFSSYFFLELGFYQAQEHSP
jgi:hypothetical protein